MIIINKENGKAYTWDKTIFKRNMFYLVGAITLIALYLTVSTMEYNTLVSLAK